MTNNQIPDKPLFFQGRWWFISEGRNYFYYIDMEGSHKGEYYPGKYFPFRDSFNFSNLSSDLWIWPNES